MFRWLRKLVSRRNSRRDIFVYHDGTRQRSIDPWAALLAAYSDPECDLKVIWPAVCRGDTEATVQYEGLVRRVFGVQQYDPETDQGLTVLETHDLFRDFWAYIAELKKKRAISPTPSPPSESRSSATPASSTTKPAPDSSFTGNESSSAAPT